MDRERFISSFARRLTQIMKEEGYESNRINATVDISKLAKAAGCSYQMARKYILGKALPELHVVFKIASWLEVTPGWLLFGNNDAQSPKSKIGAIIEIEPSLLKYILNKSMVLFSLANNKEDIMNFIVDTVYDASHLNADAKTVYKIIDMMISSATLLSNSNKEAAIACNN